MPAFKWSLSHGSLLGLLQALSIKGFWGKGTGGWGAHNPLRWRCCASATGISGALGVLTHRKVLRSCWHLGIGEFLLPLKP